MGTWDDFDIGDKVKTKKGSRYSGGFTGVVVSYCEPYKGFDAVMVKKNLTKKAKNYLYGKKVVRCLTQNLELR